MSKTGLQKMSKGKLEWSTDYDRFEYHDYNRPEHKDNQLQESMKAVGFMPSSPIQCIRNGENKLKVIRGHHRFAMAKRLKIPFCYVVDESNTDIYSLEGSGKQDWNLADFAYSRAKAGDDNCEKLIWFREKHGLTWGSAASLVGGGTGENNKLRAIKKGTFKVGELKTASKVVAITDACRDSGVPFATNGAFVMAITYCLFVPEFDADYFLHKVKLFGANLRKRGRVDEYLEEIEALYNYGTKKRQIPLAFMAKAQARDRASTFGGKNKK